MDKQKTVVIKLKGGMGNQMFQYAFGLVLEKSAQDAGIPINLLFDVTAYTDPIKKDTRRPYMLELLNTHASIASDAVALKARNPYGIISKITRRIKNKIQTENIVAYNPELFQGPYKDYYEGYWQSEKYFLDMEEQIRTEFTLREPLGTVAQSMLDSIALEPNSVSIFYRRTDYVGHSVFDIGEQEYQLRAITRMRELVPYLKFYVMSDDIEWVRDNVELPPGSVYVSSPLTQSPKEIPAHEEMFLAAACKHHIIPNSTFAWWGAWLSKNPNKIVIAPKDWVRGDSSEYKDITPPDWLRV